MLSALANVASTLQKTAIEKAIAIDEVRNRCFDCKLSLVGDNLQSKTLFLMVFALCLSHIMRKPVFCICENKGTDQLRGISMQLISAFVFATYRQNVQYLYCLNLNFQASSHLLCSTVCVRTRREPNRHVFSRRDSFWIAAYTM